MYDFQILKGSSDKYNLNKDYVKVLHKRVYVHPLGLLKQDSQRQQLHQHQENAHSSMHTLASKDTNVWLGNCSFSRNEQPRRTDWKSLPIKNTWFLGYRRKMWSCDTVFHKTTSLECSGKIFFVKMILGTDFNISFVTVLIEAIVYPLCVIPDSGGDRDIYFVVLPKRNWSQFFGERIIITNNI